MAVKVLMVLTNHDQLGNTGRKTGWYLPEVAHPYHIFKKNEYEIVTCSPKGGVAPMVSFYCFEKQPSGVILENRLSWNRLQISFIILSVFKQINQLLFPLKSSDNHRFSDDLRGNRGQLIHLKSFNIRSKSWRRPFNPFVPKQYMRLSHH